jgi:hypothetical protein
MLGPLNILKRYVLIGGIVLLVISCSFAVIQSIRLGRSHEKINSLSEKVEAYQEAALLMEDLRKTNEKLATERDELLRELQDAEGYDTPLPGDIRDLLERMRNSRADRTPQLRF